MDLGWMRWGWWRRVGTGPEHLRRGRLGEDAARRRLQELGLRFLADTEWLEHFPELAALRGTPQDPEWHPEGDVFTHTAHCCDALVKLPEWQAADETSRIAWMQARSMVKEGVLKDQVAAVSAGLLVAGVVAVGSLSVVLNLLKAVFL